MAIKGENVITVKEGSNASSLKPARSIGQMSMVSDGYGTRDRHKKRLMISAERKMAFRFLFGVFITIFINYIDRTNLAFASVQLNADIGLSPSVYGLGSGLFFISYAFFQLPSNIALDFFGGPIWISFICFTWGAVAAGFAGIKSEATFLLLRFLLGIFEAGAFPGMVFYVSMFYPRHRTQVPMTAIVMGILISQCVGAAMAAGFLSMDGLGGLRGWQWLFLIEGLMCVLVSAYWFFLMPRSIQGMTFLSEEERDVLQEIMDEQASQEKKHEGHRTWKGYWSKIKSACHNPVTFAAAAWHFFYFWAYYGIIYWAPMFVNAVLGKPLASKSTKADVTTVLLTAIPYAAAAVWQVIYSWHSQYREEKRWHIVGSWMSAAVLMCLLPTAMKSSVTAAFAVFILTTMFVYGAFSISQSYLSGLLGAERGMGGAIQNSIGNLGGFVGPYVIGALYQGTGSHHSGMYVMGAGLAMSCVIVAAYQPRWSEAKAMPHAPSSANLGGAKVLGAKDASSNGSDFSDDPKKAVADKV